MPLPPNIFSHGADDACESFQPFAQLADPGIRYVIAMTPRSGSSYLCDVLHRTGVLGKPEERLNADFIPDILKVVPGTDADTYLRNNYREAQSPNGVSGIKASWFQFHDFRAAMASLEVLGGLRYVYLDRSDTVLQAISLYRAVSSGVFHTNVEHSGEALRSLGALPYDFAVIDAWHDHILEQRSGWEFFFEVEEITPLRISYEEIHQNVDSVVCAISKFLGVVLPHDRVPSDASVFHKLDHDTSDAWKQRFLRDRAGRRLPYSE